MVDLRRVFHRALDSHRTKGTRSLVVAAVKYLQEKTALHYSSFVRSLFPVIRPYEISGVRVPNSVWYPHIKYEGYIPFYPPSPCHVWGEEGVIKSHHAVTGRGDDIVIVGGGFGVTAVWASRESETGSVTIFEAADSQAAVVRETLALNDVTTEWSVQERAVGPDVFELYGDGGRASVDPIRPSSLPEADILELDCEGSELSILQNLTIRPNALIVEIHPYKGEFSATAVLDELEQMGYQTVRRYTHLGVELTHQQLLDKLRERVKTQGAGLPPIVVAVDDT